jgi:hypothetical protein
LNPKLFYTYQLLKIFMKENHFHNLWFWWSWKPNGRQVRPGHFDGVGTIVNAFWNSRTNKRLFWRKDFQQLQIVKKWLQNHLNQRNYCPIHEADLQWALETNNSAQEESRLPHLQNTKRSKRKFEIKLTSFQNGFKTIENLILTWIFQIADETHTLWKKKIKKYRAL